MKRSIKSPQLNERRMFFKVDAGGAAFLVGAHQGTLTHTGAGDWLITFANPYARACQGIACGAEEDCIANIGTTTVSTIQIITEGVAGAHADRDFCVDVIGWDAQDEI